MAAITQIRQRHSDSRAYYDRKIAEGKATKRPFGSLGRQISDAVYGLYRSKSRDGVVSWMLAESSSTTAAS
jgi:hypothetical protein